MGRTVMCRAVPVQMPSALMVKVDSGEHRQQRQGAEADAGQKADQIDGEEHRLSLPPSRTTTPFRLRAGSELRDQPLDELAIGNERAEEHQALARLFVLGDGQ